MSDVMFSVYRWSESSPLSQAGYVLPPDGMFTPKDLALIVTRHLLPHRPHVDVHRSFQPDDLRRLHDHLDKIMKT